MSIQHYVAANANPVRPDEATHYRHLVTYADPVAAVAEAEQRVRDNPDWTNPVLLDEIEAISVTEHLPECILPKYLDAVLWGRGSPGMPVPCICDALRACEARVIAAAVQRVEANADDMNSGVDRALGARRTLNQGRAAPTGRMTMSNLPPEGTT